MQFCKEYFDMHLYTCLVVWLTVNSTLKVWLIKHSTSQLSYTLDLISIYFHPGTYNLRRFPEYKTIQFKFFSWSFFQKCPNNNLSTSSFTFFPNFQLYTILCLSEIFFQYLNHILTNITNNSLSLTTLIPSAVLPKHIHL